MKTLLLLASVMLASGALAAPLAGSNSGPFKTVRAAGHEGGGIKGIVCAGREGGGVRTDVFQNPTNF